MENLLIVNNSNSSIAVHAPEINKVLEIKKKSSLKISKAEYDIIKHRLGVLADKLSIEAEQVSATEEVSAPEVKHVDDPAKSSQREEVRKQLLELKGQIKLEKNADKKAELKKQFNDLKLKLE